MIADQFDPRMDARRRELLHIAARASFPFGPRFEHATFDTFQAPDPAQARARDLVRDLCRQVIDGTHAGRWVVLYGPPGSGKTHLLAAAYWWLAANLIPERLNVQPWELPRVYFAGEFYDGVRSEVYDGSRRNNDPESLRAAVKRRLFGPIVLLDDFGVGAVPITAQSQSAQEITFNLANELYNAGRPLLMATNLPLERPKRGGLRLQDVLGARAWDRAGEVAKFVHCNWPSHRQDGGLL